MFYQPFKDLKLKKIIKFTEERYQRFLFLWNNGSGCDRIRLYTVACKHMEKLFQKRLFEETNAKQWLVDALTIPDIRDKIYINVLEPVIGFNLIDESEESKEARIANPLLVLTNFTEKDFE